MRENFIKIGSVLFCMLLACQISFAQVSVTGTIVDSATGETLPGASVMLKNSTTGTVTDVNGNFTLTVPGLNSVLQVKYLGYQDLEIVLNGRNEVRISLTRGGAELDEVVVVGYGVQKRANVTGSVATVKAEDLTRAPVASTTNLLTGRMPGLVSVQSSGQPGADGAGLSIRGYGNALVIVDGAEMEFNNIDPNQIESVTILKDASASIYGARAGNGVILVTTKRGTTGKPVITLNSAASFQGVTQMPRMVSAGQHAELRREEWINEGSIGSAPFTEEEIQKYYDGTDPQYPNTDWIDVLTREWAPQQQHNLNVRGGSEQIKYFGMLGYLDQGTMFVNSGGAYKRYNLQSNIDAKILDNLNLRFDISGKVEDRNFSSRGWSGDNLTNSIWGDFWNTLPTAPASLPDPTKIPNTSGPGGGLNSAYLSTNRDIWGYDDDDASNINTTLQLEYQLKAVPGLSAKAFANYRKDAATSKTFQKAFETYNYDYASNIYTESTSQGATGLTLRKDDYHMLTGQFSLNYAQTFNKDHNISVLAMYEVIDEKSNWVSGNRQGFLTNEVDQIFAGSTNNMRADGSAAEMGRASYIGRLNYNYKEKYLIDLSLRADASAKFPPETRWGYFPGVSAGWIISKESFMKNLTFLDHLKLRASYGKSGLDNVGNFQYLAGYVFSDTYIFEGTNVEQGIAPTGLPNPNLTWEEVTISNIGLDFQLFNRKLYGEIEGYYRTRTGIPATRLASLPNTFGASLPPENLNSQNNRGFDLLLGTEGKLGEFRWDVSGNISWNRAKWDHFEEPVYTDPDQIRRYQNSGQWSDRAFGYLSDGLFTSMEEIQNLPFNQDNASPQNSTLRPGDIRYVDVNGDGLLDYKDEVELGKVGPPRWNYGISTNFKYKNFDMSALFQGTFDKLVNVNLAARDNVYPEVLYELRWTEENNNRNALVPRIGGSALNNAASDYRLKSAAYIRLKQFSLGYNFSNSLMKSINVSNLRVYIAGTNLLTISKLNKYNLDPEMPSGLAAMYYPQQRTVSFGLNLSL